jgi:ectoine hydroxylase-related dioxygenase (phytanoyl-CoA dioxygenase family)
MMAATSSPQVTLVKLSPGELATQQIGSHNLQHAIEALHRDGIVVLENAVDTAHLDKLNDRMVPEAETLFVRASTHRNFGPGTGNIQQEPVLEKEYIFQDVLANPFAVQVTECLFGPQPALRFYSANTAFKAENRQPVHVDVNFDFPKVPWGYAININLVDTKPENGATEVWLGSHANTTKDVLDPQFNHKQVREELLQERRNMGFQGIQPSLPKGSLIIRDLRLWHAGMPNRTDVPRVMLVTILFPHWYRSEQKIILPKSLQGHTNWGDVNVCVEWAEDGHDYLQGRHDHDFSLKP